MTDVVQAHRAVPSKLNLAIVNHNTSGNNIVIAGIAGKTIRIWEEDICPDSAVVVTPCSYNSTGPVATALAGPQKIGAGVVKCRSALDKAPYHSNQAIPIYTCLVNEGFSYTLGGAVVLGGSVRYTQD